MTAFIRNVLSLFMLVAVSGALLVLGSCEPQQEGETGEVTAPTEQVEPAPATTQEQATGAEAQEAAPAETEPATADTTPMEGGEMKCQPGKCGDGKCGGGK